MIARPAGIILAIKTLPVGIMQRDNVEACVKDVYFVLLLCHPSSPILLN